MEKSKFVKFDVVNYEESLAFKFNKSNREVNIRHLNNIKRSFSADLELIPAITVNINTMNVIDGQHRLVAFRSLAENNSIEKDVKALKVMYVSIDPDNELSVIRTANEVMKKWATGDYVQSHVSEGVADYVKLFDWCKKHPLLLDSKGLPRCSYLSSIVFGSSSTGLLRSGFIKVPDEKLDEADKVYEEIEWFINYLNLPIGIDALASTWHKFRNLAPFEYWKVAMNENQENLDFSGRLSSDRWQGIFQYLGGYIESYMRKKD